MTKVHQILIETRSESEGRSTQKIYRKVFSRPGSQREVSADGPTVFIKQLYLPFEKTI